MKINYICQLLIINEGELLVLQTKINIEALVAVFVATELSVRDLTEIAFIDAIKHFVIKFLL